MTLFPDPSPLVKCFACETFDVPCPAFQEMLYGQA